MEESITCKVCAEEFSDEDGLIPRILTACGHSFCETCLKKLQNKTYVAKKAYLEGIDGKYRKKVTKSVQYSITCPKCKTRTISDFPSRVPYQRTMAT